MVQNILAAEFSAPQSLFPNHQGSIAPELSFTENESADVYLAIRINAEGDLYFVSENNGITTEALPYKSIHEYSGHIELPEYDTSSLPALQAQFFQVSVKLGESIYDTNNWIGGVEGLNIINFSVGQSSVIDGDLDGDGWSDDDLNKDGFHDDDYNLDGYHDDDLDKNGHHDSDDNDLNDNDDDDNDLNDDNDDDNDLNDDNDNDHDNDDHDNDSPTTTTTTVTPTASIDRGRSTYNANCTGCHGTKPLNNQSSILKASSASSTSRAIASNKGGMGYLSNLSSVDIQDIADYINSL